MVDISLCQLKILDNKAKQQRFRLVRWTVPGVVIGHETIQQVNHLTSLTDLEQLLR